MLTSNILSYGNVICCLTSSSWKDLCSFYEYKLIVDVVLDTWPVVGSGFWLLPILPNLFVYRKSVATTCWISSRWFLTLFKMPSPPLLYGQRFQLYQRNINLWCFHDNIKSDLCSFNPYCLRLLQSQFKISMFYTNVMWWEDSFFSNYDFVEVFTSLLCPYVLINRVKKWRKQRKTKRVDHLVLNLLNGIKCFNLCKGSDTVWIEQILTFWT